MKSWIIAGGCLSMFVATGVLVSVYTEPVELVPDKAPAYVDGATPPHIKPWEMY